MNRVVTLASAGRSLIAKFHELRLKYWSADLDVVCCFEGSDDIEFFLPRVKAELAIHPDRVDFVNCNGKRFVLGLSEMARARAWNLARLGFFVDADLDCFVAGPVAPQSQEYVTDFYSIESYVLTDEFFNSVWQENFRLSITDPRRLVWLGKYRNAGSDVAAEMLTFFATAVAVKRLGGGVEFDKIKIGDFVVLSPSSKVARKRVRAIDWSGVFLGATPTLADVRRARSELRATDYRHWFRGKYALAFAMLFLSRMKQTLGARGVADRAVVKAHFNDDYAVGCLCGRTATPASLAAFFRSWAALIIVQGVGPIGAKA